MAGTISPDEISDIEDTDLLNEDNKDWLKALEEEGIFFSFPLDIDFAMLRAFPAVYKHPNPGGRGPRGGADAIREKKSVTLKTGGSPEIYDDVYDDEFKWYPYLFLNRSKPESHFAALARIGEEFDESAPPELKRLIEYVRSELESGG